MVRSDLRVIELGAGHVGRIAAAIDGCTGSGQAIQHAAALADRHRARLTVIAVAVRPWPTVGVAGVSAVQLKRYAIDHTEAELRRLVEGIPDGVPCTTVLRYGRFIREVNAYLRQVEHELLVLPSSRALRARPR